MSEREWSHEEVVEALRQWKSEFYSESETKWLMNKAADLIESLNQTIEDVCCG